MVKEDKLIRLYTGTELNVNYLKEELELNGIPTVVRNDFNSGIVAGFSGGTSASVDLYIKEKCLKRAEPIISDFVDINER